MNKVKFRLPEVEVNTFRKSNPLICKVIENKKLFTITDEENDARHIILQTQGIRYLEGQSVGVLTPGENIKGKPHAVRLYSIASVGNDLPMAEELSLCVKRVVYEDPQGIKKFGVASNYLCDLVQKDEVLITGPAGRNFLLPVQEEIKRPYLFFATGTGVAPFRGMLQRLFKFQGEFTDEVYLFLGVKRKTELMYDEEFRGYEKYPNFHYLKALSREQKNQNGERMYIHHLIDTIRGKVTDLLQNPETLLYICGIKGMEKNILEKIAELLKQNIESEEFKKFASERVLTEIY